MHGNDVQNGGIFEDNATFESSIRLKVWNKLMNVETVKRIASIDDDSTIDL